MFNNLNQQASKPLYNPPSTMATILDEKSHLKARIYALELERDLYKGQAEVYHTHCCMSRQENKKLRRELEEKKKRGPSASTRSTPWCRS